MDIKTAQKILEENKRNYEELAEEFSNTRIYLWSELQELTKFVKDNDKILDLGCGNGRLYELFKNRPVEYVGIDNSTKLIEIARRNFQTNSKFQILNFKPKFVVADALNLPFKDSEFDLVFAIALLHHIPSEELRMKVLKNCYRVLKPGSLLILTVWNLWQPKLLIKYKLLPKILFNRDVFIPWKSPAKGIIQRYYYAFCKNELKNLIKKANFELIDSYYSRKGQRTNWFKGYNLIVIARKTLENKKLSTG
ncbi:MAG: class I SAM-dependent methyltransferase [Patescibacteria group bacterium]